MNQPVSIGKAKLFNADCREVLASLPDNSFDSIVTDPPYELGFMGKSWDKTGIAYDVELWREAMRVLKPGGHMLAFSGSRTYHRMACAIEDAGFEIRDQIMWIHGQGFPKSKNLDGDHKGWGTALKPAHEPICVARKPFVGSVTDNVLKFGTGAINIDSCRIEAEPMPANTGKGALPRRNSDETRAAAEPSQPHDLGRWPANVIHDGSDVVRAHFPDAAGQQGQVTGNEPTANGFSGNVAFSGMINRVASLPPRVDFDTSAARFFYCAKASKQDRDEGLYGFQLREAGIKNDSGRGFSETDPMRKIMRGNIHPTVKPTEVCRWMLRLVTPPGGSTLDLFMGSGSMGKAAAIEGFIYYGTEIDTEYGYFDISQARIAYAACEPVPVKPVDDVKGQQGLFA